MIRKKSRYDFDLPKAKKEKVMPSFEDDDTDDYAMRYDEDLEE